ncbi:tetratricopeptide repeat protein [Thiomicrorhabdus aquaedulcis]|uniref:tetratricopeptide repeat protein n=1 Tax=Thiomicrorhabdus aquaedulcis TaxID=2211106 RepID=UPI001562DB43|nr:tetratricopeptide repeat protein [Thiomicrorhabdus aquaedulcis]
MTDTSTSASASSASVATAMIADINDSNFQELVMRNSQRFVVLVHFWSALNPQSLLANTLLEKLAHQFAGQFILAKINVEQQRALAQKLGVSDVPFYKLVKDGKMITENAGLLPEAAYRSLLTHNITQEPSEVLRLQATEAFAQGQFDQAVQLLGDAARENPNNFKIHLDLVAMYLHTDHLENAQNLFEKLPQVAQDDPKGKFLRGLLVFSGLVKDAPSIETLQARLAQQPNTHGNGNTSANQDDPEALYYLAGYLMVNAQYQNALQCLFKLFSVNRAYLDGAPQKLILTALDMLAADYPDLIIQSRRKFQSLLF